MSPTVAQHQFLSPALSLSQSQTRCTAFQQVALQRWCGLHFWNCRSLSLCLCLGLCLCAAPLCVDLSGANTLSAHSGQIFMLCLFIIVFISLLLCCFFLSSCRTVAVVIVVFGLFMAFFRCTCAKFKAALSSPYQRRRRRSLNS